MEDFGILGMIIPQTHYTTNVDSEYLYGREELKEWIIKWIKALDDVTTRFAFLGESSEPILENRMLAQRVMKYLMDINDKEVKL